jgi:hypothetical protein
MRIFGSDRNLSRAEVVMHETVFCRRTLEAVLGEAAQWPRARSEAPIPHGSFYSSV